MISGQWFYRRRFSKNWQKIAPNYPSFHEKKDSTPILTSLVGVHPRNIHTKFEANPCSGLREEVEKLDKDDNDDDDDGHSLIVRVTLTH